MIDWVVRVWRHHAVLYTRASAAVMPHSDGKEVPNKEVDEVEDNEDDAGYKDEDEEEDEEKD